MNIEPCLYCGDNLKELVSGDAQCLGCGAIVEYCNIPLHNRISRIVRAAEMLAKVLPEKWQQDILIRWLDGYDMIKGTTSKEIQTVMGELFGKAGDLKEAVEGGRA